MQSAESAKYMSAHSGSDPFGNEPPCWVANEPFGEGLGGLLIQPVPKRKHSMYGIIPIVHRSLTPPQCGKHKLWSVGVCDSMCQISCAWTNEPLMQQLWPPVELLWRCDPSWVTYDSWTTQLLQTILNLYTVCSKPQHLIHMVLWDVSNETSWRKHRDGFSN